MGQRLQRGVGVAAVGTMLALTACGSDGDGGGNTSSGGSAGSGGSSAGNGGSSGSAGSGGTAGSSSGSGGMAGTGGTTEPPDTSPMGGDRPVTPVVPASYDPDEPTPLMVMLHGYSASNVLQNFIFGFKELAEEYGYIYIAPNGTVDASDNRFWNATDYCCDFLDTGVDDVAYIRGLIEEAQARYNVDPKRIFLTGHSNGGFMSHRFACEHPELVAGFMSLAGAIVSDPDTCQPSEPVASLQVHGTADATITYDGQFSAERNAQQVSAEDGQAVWASRNGCSGTSLELRSSADFVPATAGEETELLSYGGCPSGGSVDLWRMNDVGHVPQPNDEWRRAVLDWLYANPKP